MKASIIRAGAVAVTTVLATTFALASAAPAATTGSFPAADFTWTVPNAGPAVTGRLALGGAAPIANTKLSLDFGRLSGVATVAVAGPFPCTTAGSVVTCPEGNKGAGDADSGWQALLDVTLTPLAGATEGKVVTVPLTTVADGRRPDTGSLRITFTGHPILSTAFPPPALTAQGGSAASLGDHLTLAPVVHNAGRAATSTVVVTFALSHALEPDPYDNCLYAPFPEQDGQYVRCTVTAALAPGAAGALQGFQVTVPQNAPPVAIARVAVDPDAAGSGDPFPPPGVHFSAQPPSGHTVTLGDAGGSDVPANDPASTFHPLPLIFNVAGGSHDTAVSPVDLVGAVGATVDAPVGVENLGPGEMGAASPDVVRARVQVPSGAVATTVPAGCAASSTDQGLTTDRPVTHGRKPGFPWYYCTGSAFVLPVGATYTFAFRFRITQPSGTDGSVTVWLDDGTDPDDNTAPITLSLTGPPPPSGSASPLLPSTPASGTSPPPVAGAAAVGGSTPGTGFTLDTWVMGGAILVLIGLALLILSRRRRPA